MRKRWEGETVVVGINFELQFFGITWHRRYVINHVYPRKRFPSHESETGLRMVTFRVLTNWFSSLRRKKIHCVHSSSVTVHVTLTKRTHKIIFVCATADELTGDNRGNTACRDARHRFRPKNPTRKKNPNFVGCSGQ